MTPLIHTIVIRHQWGLKSCVCFSLQLSSSVFCKYLHRYQIRWGPFRERIQFILHYCVENESNRKLIFLHVICKRTYFFKKNLSCVKEKLKIKGSKSTRARCLFNTQREAWSASWRARPQSREQFVLCLRLGDFVLRDRRTPPHRGHRSYLLREGVKVGSGCVTAVWFYAHRQRKASAPSCTLRLKFNRTDWATFLRGQTLSGGNAFPLKSPPPSQSGRRAGGRACEWCTQSPEVPANWSHSDGQVSLCTFGSCYIRMSLTLLDNFVFAGPTQQLDSKINEFKHKQTSWNMPE